METRKTALVTGAAKGIGRQIAYCMAEAGYNVIVNYHSNKAAAEELCREMEKFGVQTMTVYADMGKVADIEEMYRQVFEVFSVVDVLVNNAGISSEAYFLDATEEMFDQMTAIDWKGVYFSSQIAAKKMIEQKVKGTIINLSSNQINGCWPRATIYAPNKAAISKFTKNAGKERQRPSTLLLW